MPGPPISRASIMSHMRVNTLAGALNPGYELQFAKLKTRSSRCESSSV